MATPAKPEITLKNYLTVGPGEYPCGNNLYLILSPSGGRRWTFRYQRAGIVKKMGLGSAKAHKGRKPAEAKDRQLHVILDNLNTHKKNEHWLKAHPKRPLSFHADQYVLAQSGRGMVLDLARAVAQRRPLHKPQTTAGAHRCLRQRL